ncbi:MAG: filamentous hemagglutinin N-terminal domain-containing protein, partial [Anaplasmataceae bacterium]|nr:filamentous hemagglutinin N-terminal domain-containing protein [Anaplasmataceae bacterium]
MITVLKGILILLGLAIVRSLVALPSGEEVRMGEATFCPDKNVLSISTSDKAIIEYQKFNIGKDETVEFIQPSTSSSVLNRVVGGHPSEILGRLQSNGRIFLVNPKGVYFGADAVVNAGAFLATSLSISDEDFLNDSFIFALEKGVDGSIINEGTIQADGFVALFAPTVENRGRVVARAEKILIGAAEKVTLDLIGDGLIRFRVDGELEKALIENYGKIEAANGDVQISLKTAKRAIQSVLNTDGIEVAAAIEESHGVIRLVGASEVAAKNVHIEGERVEVGGVIGAAQEDKGGTVQVLGDQLHLMSAMIDASGEMGGGAVLIGGDYQGKGSVRNAQFTVVDPSSKIYADATREGDGGKVIVWADDTTFFEGKILARGGRLGGNGGFVETSGKENLGIQSGFVDTSAPMGKFGCWFLDPSAINVIAGGRGTLANAANCGKNSTVSISPATINASTSNVVLCSQRNAKSSITINNAIAMSTSGVSLTMTAGSGNTGPIIFNAGVSTNGGAIVINGVVTLGANTLIDTTNAGGSPTGANITFNSTVDGAFGLTLKGGTRGVVSYGVIGGTTALTALTATAATVIQNATAKVTTGGISYTAPIAINLGGNLTTSASPVSLTGPVTFNANMTIDTTNAKASSAGANITLSSIVNGASSLTLNGGTAGTVSYGAIGGITPLTAFTVTGATVTQNATAKVTTGGISYTAPTAINLDGNLTTSASPVSLTGPVT